MTSSSLPKFTNIVKMDYLVLERQTLTINPIKPSHFLRQGRPLPKKLSQDQVGTLLAQVTNPMDHALELLGLRCGLRVSEVAHLRRSDLDWEQQALRIDQGKAARIVYGQVALQAEKQKAPSVSGGLT